MDLRAALSLLLILGLSCAVEDIDHGTANEEDLTTVIMKMNNGSDGYLLEGDILIPTQRTAMKCRNSKYSCLWPRRASGFVEVPYVISSHYDSTERKAIFTAMNEFKVKTCIRFVPRGREVAYLSIEPRAGCFSSLGRIGDRQVVSLQRFGCVQKGVIEHELLHALGFYHEHTRQDRDNYVIIKWNNIPSCESVRRGLGNARCVLLLRSVFNDSSFCLPDMQYNFEKQDTDYLQTAYDYTSVMHYGKTAFANSGTQSIVPIPDSSVSIGQRLTMSQTDLLRIKRLYRC
ncbi:low choriolytic enzyme-like isoform 1-T1 [Spinachia spinachia]